MVVITYDSSSVRPRTFADSTLTNKPWVAAISPIVLLGAWELAGRTGVLDVRFFSTPTRVLSSLWEMAVAGDLWSHVYVSITRVVIGFAIGASLGLVVGLMMGASPTIRSALRGTVDALFPVPKIAILPLMLMILGIGEASKYATIAVGVFFPVVINTMAGVMNIPRIYVEVGQNYGASPFQVYRTIALPGALPMIFAGLKVSVAVALVLIVAAEFVGANEGIGYLIWHSWQIFNIDQLFIGLLLISIMGVAVAVGLRALERRVVPWQR